MNTASFPAAQCFSRPMKKKYLEKPTAKSQWQQSEIYKSKESGMKARSKIIEKIITWKLLYKNESEA